MNTPTGADDNRTRTKILFRGLEILITMDDRSTEGKSWTHSSLVVYKDDEDVTARFIEKDVDENGIRDCTSDDLFEVMSAIARLEPLRDAFGKFILVQQR